MRRFIRRVWRSDKNPLDRLWRWASGADSAKVRWHRWRALKKWAGDHARIVAAELTTSRRARQQAIDDLHELHDRLVASSEHIEGLKARREEAEAAGDTHAVQEFTAKIEDERAELERLRERIQSNEVQKKRARARVEDARARRRAWLTRRTIYRRRARRARERYEENKDSGGVPVWEDWMANGRDARVTDAVKAEVAFAVVVFGLAVSSLYRSTVISGSNPGSYHGPNVYPGRAGDLVGARMTEYQRNVYVRRRGNCAECFGPDNYANLKNGAPLVLGEGTFLENLHDSHTHVAP